MLKIKSFYIVLIFLITLVKFNNTYGQKVFTLKNAIAEGIKNYGIIKAKTKYAEASKIAVKQAKRENIPNFNLSAQQDYGTVNGQFGPLFGFGGLGLASSGPAFDKQYSNAAFGAAYLANINWEFFAFGKARGKVKVAEAIVEKDYKDLDQELFQHKIKIAAAYLNLVAAQQLKLSFEKNLNRADTFRRIVNAKVLSGIIPGVDSSQANAEYSSAKIVLTKSIDQEAVLSNQLFQLIGIDPQAYILDSFFINRIPKLSEDSVVFEKHPLLQFYRSRINVSDVQSKFIRKSASPVFAMVGVFQGRGSGFNSAYLFDPLDFTKNYWSGTNPTRVNYLLGVGLTWNIIQPFRISQQVKSQNLISKGLQEEYVLANQQIAAQLKLADIKLKNALLIYNEVPIQIKAATDAYVQKSVLYKNGLTNLVDLTQILYVLIRAETDRDIAYNNVWQALLSKAASAGDFSIFENQF